MSNKSRSNPPWSEIPPEIVLKIGELTGYPIYQTRIRAVCKPWRSAFAHVENRGIKNFPLKIPHHPSLRYGSESLFIIQTMSYVIQTVNGSFEGSSFLVTVDEINPGFVSPRYPLSVAGKSVLGIGNPSKGLDLLENRVTFINPGFSLCLLEVQGTKSKNKYGGGKLGYYIRGDSVKALVCKNPCCEEDLLIIVLSNKNKLMALRVRDGEWKTVFDGEVLRCLDVVKFKDEIYGIDHLGGAYFVDYDYESGDANVVSVAPSVKDGGERARRLVVDSSSNERLYMVALRTHKDDIAFIVYRLKEDLGVWEKVKSIGNRMFFIGVDFSFCATSHDFPGLARSCMHSIPQNCIFFSKGSFPRRSYEFHGDEQLFETNKEGTGMHIGQYYLRAKCATGLLEPAFVIMFSHPF